MITKIKSFFKKTESTRLFLEVLKEYTNKSSVENCLREATILKHQQYYNNISLFLYSKQMANVTLNDVSPKMMEQLKYWLHSNLVTCSATHSARHIELCKRTMKYARQMNYVINNPINEVDTIKSKPKSITHLEQNELNKLMSYNFNNDIFKIVADLYAFQCYTGLSYGDLYSYEVVLNGKDEWIKGSRLKNDAPYMVYFFKEAKEIHNKYCCKLPYISNQSYNRILKEIAHILVIKKTLTTHTGRKTHATLLDQMGVSAKTIANQLGNTEQVCEKHYIKNSFTRTLNEFNRLGIKESLIFNT